MEFTNGVQCFCWIFFVSFEPASVPQLTKNLFLIVTFFSIWSFNDLYFDHVSLFVLLCGKYSLLYPFDTPIKD